VAIPVARLQKLNHFSRTAEEAIKGANTEAKTKEFGQRN
jgi:hypothetical protein